MLIQNENLKNIPPLPNCNILLRLDKPLGGFFIMGQLNLFEQEIWKDTKYYGYQVSNLGQMRTIDRMVKHSKGGLMKRLGRPLKLQKGVHGRMYVHISINGKHKSCLVSRLVLQTFTYESRLDVDHLDMDVNNNRLSNLEYVGHRENIRRCYTMKRGGMGYYRKSKGAYELTVYINGKNVNFGRFKTLKESTEMHKLIVGDIENYEKYLFKRKHNLPKGIKNNGNGFSALKTVNKKRVYIGYFRTVEAAKEAYDKF